LETFWKNDLSERLGPMTTKELRQSLRRGSFVIPFLLIQFLAVVATAVEFQKPAALLLKQAAGMLNLALLWSSGPFWMVVGVVCVVVMPLGGIILMSQELEEGNHELLLLTKLDRWKVVLGKFLTLWGLCALTFISLLPFVVVRYLLGGIEWWYELACSMTVLGGSALVCAGVIGASAWKTIGGRIGILLLFLASMLAGCSIPLGVSAAVSGGCGWLYHLTAFSAVACYVALGLALARSRLRLVVLAYEVKPSGMLIALLVCAPFAIGMATAITVGWGGWVGLLGMGFVAIRLDLSPKAPKWIKPPVANTPAPPLPESPI
jgi:ABC-type transport system involved in multi-copper enzyme maturation permease subunit